LAQKNGGDSKQPHLVVVSGTNFLRSYSGVKYLCDSLAARGVDVELYAPIPRNMLPELRGSRIIPHSLFVPWYGRVPRIRAYAFRIQILVRGLSGSNAGLLFSELSFFREAVLIKKLRPRVPLVHYCQELLTREEFPGMRAVRFYELHASVPDLIVDVDQHRAAIRRNRFRIRQEIMVLRNTLPMSAVPPPAPDGSLSELAGGGLPAGVPILAYIGGIHRGTGLNRVLEALEGLHRPCFFLGFCHGRNRRAVESFRREVESRLGPQRGRICQAVPRARLLACLHEADAGLVYYPYSELPSINQRYCAPTKMYEYIAAGLPVVASVNPPMLELIQGNGLGVCAEDDSPEALRRAIDAVLDQTANRAAHSRRAREIFAEELCFERVSAPVVEGILALLQ
jgi:glycosyltransferase involved in cell wall biosynthesis